MGFIETLLSDLPRSPLRALALLLHSGALRAVVAAAAAVRAPATGSTAWQVSIVFRTRGPHVRECTSM